MELLRLANGAVAYSPSVKTNFTHTLWKLNEFGTKLIAVKNDAPNPENPRKTLEELGVEFNRN